MSPADRRYWLLAHRRVAGLQSDVAAALLRGYAIVREQLSEAELVRLIESGNLERLIATALDDATLERAFIPFRARLRTTVEKGFRFTVPDLPKAGKIDGVLAVSFDHVSPNVVQAIRDLDTTVMTALKTEVRDSVREAVRVGYERGAAPRTIAREIRPSIGLGKEQIRQVAAFRADLEAGKSVERFTLRNKAVDRLMAKGPLTSEQVDRYTETYRRARVAQNANTVSRTATADAYRKGQDLSWREAKASGVVPETATLTKTWIQIQRPSKRPDHAEMNGETVDFEDSYSNGSMIPGDQGEYNCGCLSRMRVART